MTNNLPAAAASPQPCEDRDYGLPGAHMRVVYPERSLYYREEVRVAVNEALERAAKIAEETTERPDDWNVPGLIAQRIREGLK